MSLIAFTGEQNHIHYIVFDDQTDDKPWKMISLDKSKF